MAFDSAGVAAMRVGVARPASKQRSSMVTLRVALLAKAQRTHADGRDRLAADIEGFVSVRICVARFALNRPAPPRLATLVS